MLVTLVKLMQSNKSVSVLQQTLEEKVTMATDNGFELDEISKCLNLG